ncbi:MAG: fused MFS/spermidine synthase, partial [Gemmatimonadetes bacterium]|nr:fused MFS/spermidine synthase [Gemmatimonadota bacterium]
MTHNQNANSSADWPTSTAHWGDRVPAAALYCLFALSGAAGLIYELLWARYLGLFVGHTAYAQILVLGIFLGGMSAGALLVGSRSQRVRNPLRWYMGIEVLIGLMGFVFHGLYTVTTGAAYDVLFPALGSGLSLQIVKWTIAALLILPQSVLLGTTFPLMNAAVLRRYPHRPGRTLAILYSANSLGAAAGVLIAGFWLLALVGLQGTVLLAAAVNFLVAFGARFVLMASPEPPLPLPDAAARATGASPPGITPLEVPRRLQRLLLGVAFGTAVASFIYEIGWIRMLSLVFGSATHSFELMLSAFILGLALGSFWCRTRADRWHDPVRALGVVQWIMGAAAIATLPLYVASFEWMAWLMNTFTRTDGGYLGLAFARYGIALAIMLPSTFCAGVVLPLLTRILVVGGPGESAIGKVYGVNTLGSIMGVVTAGLMLLPLIGLKAMLVLGGTLDMALGAVLLFAVAERRSSVRPWALGAAAATAVLAASGLIARGFDTRLLSSTVFRDGEIPPPGSQEPVFHRDGRTATISVQRNLNSGLQIISTNGKPDASIPAYWFEPCTDEGQRQPLARDMATQTLAPLVSLAHAPNARTVAVIGHGSGMTSHFLLGNPAIDELVTVEIEPNMVRGSRAFYPTNRRVFDDARST